MVLRCLRLLSTLSACRTRPNARHPCRVASYRPTWGCQVRLAWLAHQMDCSAEDHVRPLPIGHGYACTLCPRYPRQLYHAICTLAHRAPTQDCRASLLLSHPRHGLPSRVQTLARHRRYDGTSMVSGHQEPGGVQGAHDIGDHHNNGEWSCSLAQSPSRNCQCSGSLHRDRPEQNPRKD